MYCARFKLKISKPLYQIKAKTAGHQTTENFEIKEIVAFFTTSNASVRNHPFATPPPPSTSTLPLTPVYVDSAVIGSRENNGKLVYDVLIYTKTMFLMTRFWWFLFQTSN